MDICPPEHLPRYQVGGKWLENEERKNALENGRRLGENFNSVISSKIKKLQKIQFGSQFFHPTSVGGLFVNANATYVVSFLPADKKGMKISSRVPKEECWRCFYGYMAINYETTETVNCLIDHQLKGAEYDEYTLFVSRTEEMAIEGGYDASKHKLLLWSEGIKTCGLVLRYLHFTEDDNDAHSELAELERDKLTKLNGTHKALKEVELGGVGEIEYF